MFHSAPRFVPGLPLKGPRRIGSELADPPHPNKRSDSLREAGAGSCSATTGPQGHPTWTIAFTTHGAIA
jgi:hypothetical protein